MMLSSWMLELLLQELGRRELGEPGSAEQMEQTIRAFLAQVPSRRPCASPLATCLLPDTASCTSPYIYFWTSERDMEY